VGPTNAGASWPDWTPKRQVPSPRLARDRLDAAALFWVRTACRLNEHTSVELCAQHRDQAKPRRRSNSRLISALVISLSPLSSIFLRRRLSLIPKGDGGLPGGGSRSFRVLLFFAVFFINHILPPKRCQKFRLLAQFSTTTKTPGHQV
jgi:hypothetical protein